MHLRSSLTLISVIASLGAIACGSEANEGNNVDGTGGDDGAGGEPGTGGKPGSGGVPNIDTAGIRPCDIHTDFEGDTQCLLAPEKDLGMQLYMGPGEENYDNPDVINAVAADGRPIWLVYPGDERTQNYHVYTPNETGIYYFKQHYRMRPGSHHMIIQGSDDKDSPEGFVNSFGNIVGSIGGTQHITEDLPPGGIVAEEDKGLGRGMEPHTALDVQLHFYNVTDNVRLREAWVNLMYKPKEEVTSNLGMLGGFIIPMNIPPHTQKTVTSVCKAENFLPNADEVRVVTLFGHAHTHNTRFAVWHDKADGESQLVYDSYEGAEAPTYTYNTIVENPDTDPDTRTTGGKSGLLTLKPGEQLRFACDVDNDTDFTFLGRNEVNTDEMCNLFGSVQGLGFPCFDLSRFGGGASKPPAMP